MCGIVGFTGKHQAAPILLDGLKKLEYRGYDSAGLAVRDGSKLAEVVKATGKLSNLIQKTNEGKAQVKADKIIKVDFEDKYVKKTQKKTEKKTEKKAEKK